MKKIIFVLFLLVGNHFVSNAQSMVDSALRYQKYQMPFLSAVENKIAEMQTEEPDDTTEGSMVNEFSRKTKYIKKYLSTDAPQDSDMLYPAYQSMLRFIMQPDAYCIGGGGHWQNVGPFTSYYSYEVVENQGRVNAVWASATHPDSVVAATYGGLWRSNNGGHSWHNISDGASIGASGNKIPGTMGMVKLAVDPLNHDSISVFLADWGGIGIGIAHTGNGGDTWYFDTSFNSTAGYTYFSGAPPLEMKYMPGTDMLFTYLNNKIFMKQNPQSVWQNITPIFSVDSIVTDLEFTKANPGKVVVSTNAVSNVSHLYIYDTTSGGSWSNVAISLPTPSSPVDTLDRIKSFSFSYLKNDSVYILMDVHTNVKFQVLGLASIVTGGIKIVNTALSATNVYTSDSNVKVIYIMPFASSNDTGHHFYFTPSYIHVDPRYFDIIHSTNTTNGLNDILVGATDGGVLMKTAGQGYLHNITGDSLCITQMFGISNMEGEDDLIIAGAQDNGTFTYNKNRSVPFASNFDHGDNMLTKFLRNGVRKAYCDNNFPSLLGIKFGDSIEYETTITSPFDTCSADYWSPCNNAYRPWFIDNNNVAYVGYREVWKKSIDSTNWHRAFNVTPLATDDDPQVCDMVIDEQDSNIAYVGYRNTTSHDTVLTGFPNRHGKLFLSFNASIIPPTWTSITPPDLGWWGLGDIEIDPNHSNRIWIGMEGQEWGSYTVPAANRTHRVLYSPNYGTTWYDVSRGLPALGINKIQYRKGSNDELYCATFLGVYKCDFSTFNPTDSPYYGITWQCFNDGMPICNVTDMELNYCAGKLRASTMGRGIWQTDLDSISLVADTLYTSATLTGNQYKTSSIYIKSGATLTLLSDTLHMPKNGAIYVEQGAHLVVNHAMLTNSCDQCFWQGIIVKGNNNAPQNNPANQGWVSITNGSTVQHAKTALTNIYTGWGYTLHSGAIIQATGSTFLNNHQVLDYETYHNWNTAHTVLYPNRSYFANCTLSVDNNYKGAKTAWPFSRHVALVDMEGISFQGCNFLNRNTGPQDSLNGEGIHALNAGFTCGAYCPSIYVPCTAPTPSRFCGFTNGISVAGAMGLSQTVSLYRTDFDSVSVGLYVSGYNNVSTTQCNFTVGHAKGVVDANSPNFLGCYQNIGIYTQNTQMFKIEGNTFIGIPSPTANFYNFGVVAANTGPTTKTLYLNTFDSLTIGACAIGCNKNHFSPYYVPTGLQINCNTFANNATDIFVAPDGSGFVPQGICTNQGNHLQTAGNNFSSAAHNVVNNCDPFAYYYYATMIDSATYPFSISGTATVNRLYTSHQNTCTTSIISSTMPMAALTGTGALDKPVLDSLVQQEEGYRNLYDSTFASYFGMMDLGNPDSLSDLIAGTGTAAQVLSLYNTLSKASPFLSQNALQQTADLLLMDSTLIASLLTLNPGYLTDADFMAYILADYAYSDSDLAAIMGHQYDSTTRTGMEDAMLAAQNGADLCSSMVMMALKSPTDKSVSVYDTTGSAICLDSTSIFYLQDSNTSYYGLEKVEKWLQHIRTSWAGYQRVGYYNFMGQYSTANTLFLDLPNIGTIDKPEKNEYKSFAKLWGAIYNADNNNRDMYQLTDKEIGALDTTSTIGFSMDAGKLSLFNLTVNYGGITPVTAQPCYYTSMQSWKKTKDKNKGKWHQQKQIAISINNTNETSNSLDAYPNPTSGQVTFSYNIQGGIQLVLTNAVGEKVYDVASQNENGNLVWDARQLPPGVYLYTATNQNGYTARGKVVVVR